MEATSVVLFFVWVVRCLADVLRDLYVWLLLHTNLSDELIERHYFGIEGALYTHESRRLQVLIKKYSRAFNGSLYLHAKKLLPYYRKLIIRKINIDTNETTLYHIDLDANTVNGRRYVFDTIILIDSTFTDSE